MSISDLRKALQEPRRPYDTPYGRWVMRRFSIYLTALFIRMPITPTQVTVLSILAGVAGAGCIVIGRVAAGWILVNVWYLLDHVDGELARHRKKVSATGLYLDTLANAIVQPFAFSALGFWLWATSGNPAWLGIGILASYNSIMLMLLPFCEATVFFQWIIDKNARYIKSSQDASQNASNARLDNPLKKIFGFLHFLTAFPSALPFFTIAAFMHSGSRPSLSVALACYALISSVVWPLILAHQIATKKLDKKISFDP